MRITFLDHSCPQRRAAMTICYRRRRGKEANRRRYIYRRIQWRVLHLFTDRRGRIDLGGWYGWRNSDIRAGREAGAWYIWGRRGHLKCTRRYRVSQLGGRPESKSQSRVMLRNFDWCTGSCCFLWRKGNTDLKEGRTWGWGSRSDGEGGEQFSRKFNSPFNGVFKVLYGLKHTP